MKITSRADAERYLRGRDWERDDSGLTRHWKNPSHGKHWVTTEEALALCLVDQVRRLEDENARLREKIKKLKEREKK